MHELKISELSMQIEEIESQMEDLKTQKADVDEEIASVKMQLKEAGVLAKTRGIYMDPTQYQGLERRKMNLGRKSQYLQREMGRVGKEARRLRANKSDLEYEMNQERYDQVRALAERRHLQWESFFVEAARQYLSGSEFEIISKRASSMQQVRAG